MEGTRIMAITMDEAIHRIIDSTIETINETCIACNITDGDICAECIAGKILDTIYDFRKN